MKLKKEVLIQKQIIDYLNSRRIFNFKVNADINTVGIPDVIACYCGYFIGIEVKRLTGVVSPIQRQVLKEIKLSGGFIVVPTSLKQVIEVLEEIDVKVLSTRNA